MARKIYSREEFELAREEWALEMSNDIELKKDALNVLTNGDKHNWFHQTNWLGEPSLQSAEDLLTFQDIIFKTKPKYIIESGVAWAGSLLFYASMVKILNLNTKVIGVDIFIPDDLKYRIESFDLANYIELINASSVENETVAKIEEIIGSSKEVMVHLDSNHTHEHVLMELNLYEKFIGKGHYLVCGDTIIDYIPEQTHRPRPWGHGNNPKTALEEFLKKNDRFKPDEKIDNKMLFSNQPKGYLKCIKE
jgi:cephalosporin hydroxylase